ncbi:PIN domain-containing protein [soil metagenome]
MEYLLDASALLAWLNGERGAQHVEPILDRSAISTINLSEVLQKSINRGANVEGLRVDLEALGITFIPFEVQDAENAADMWIETRVLGLSLGDRACLATAGRLDIPAVTADGAWTSIPNPPTEIQTIR